MNNIIIELCQEDRDRLDRVIAALEGNTHDCDRCAVSVAHAMSECLAHQAAAAPAEESQPIPEPIPEVEAPTAPQEGPAVKLADIQKKIVDLTTAGKRDAAKAVVQSYAPRLSALPEAVYTEVWEKLTALEG